MSFWGALNIIAGKASEVLATLGGEQGLDGGGGDQPSSAEGAQPLHEHRADNLELEKSQIERVCDAADRVLVLPDTAPQCAALAAEFTKETFQNFDSEIEAAATVWLVPKALWADGAVGEWRLRHVQVLSSACCFSFRRPCHFSLPELGCRGCCRHRRI